MSKKLCELCEMNPPADLTEDGEVTFLPVPEALPGKKLCKDCQQQSDQWGQDASKHIIKNHRPPYDHNCQMCSMALYTEDQERTWREHLARCKECQQSPHDFVTAPPRCRACGAEADKVPSDEVCTHSYTREMHRDIC